MKIEFSDVYKNDSFSPVSEAIVRQVVSSPDKQYSCPLGEQEWVLLSKTLSDAPSSDHTILVTALRKGDVLSISVCFIVLPDLIDDVTSIEPLDILEALADRFGLPITVGRKTKKFIHHQTFWTKTVDPKKIVEISNPENHNFIQSLWFKHEVDGSKTRVDCHTAFCIDKNRYLDWLRDGGVT